MSEHINTSLAEERKIAVIWSADDVKGVCPHLSDNQCWEVLKQALQHHDCSVGINWDVLKSQAEAMFEESGQGTGFAKRIIARRVMNNIPSTTP